MEHAATLLLREADLGQHGDEARKLLLRGGRGGRGRLFDFDERSLQLSSTERDWVREVDRDSVSLAQGDQETWRLRIDQPDPQRVVVVELHAVAAHRLRHELGARGCDLDGDGFLDPVTQRFEVERWRVDMLVRPAPREGAKRFSVGEPHEGCAPTGAPSAQRGQQFDARLSFAGVLVCQSFDSLTI